MSIYDGIFLGMTKTAARQKTVAVDFDDTIQINPGEGGYGPLTEGAKEGLDSLRAQGYRIIVFSVRGDKEGMARYMEAHDLPYDYINESPDQPPNSSGKVIADHYIDDRAVPFRGDWANVVLEPHWKESQKTASLAELRDMDLTVEKKTKKFLEHLEPGDIILTSANESKAGVGEKIWNTLSKITTGSKWTHAGIYVGEGKMLHSYEGIKSFGQYVPGSKKKVRIHSVNSMAKLNKDMLAVRPDVKQKEREKAVNTAKTLVGIPYSDRNLYLAALGGGGIREEIVKKPKSSICTGILGFVYDKLDFRKGKARKYLRPIDFLKSNQTTPVAGLDVT